jgi:type IX secretion system PorP/SprF family membrane protein
MVCFAALNVKAQDIHFSQFYENAILRNPALTGIFSGDYKAGVNYRSQWSSISAPFQTVMASAETRVIVNKEVGDYVSFGVSATYDKAGTISFNSFQIYPAINYNKALEDNHHSYLSVGFAGGYSQRSFDMSKATFSSQYTGGAFNSNNASGENMFNATMQNYDVAAGISYNSSAGPNNNVNYYVGAAGYHITKPKQSFEGNQDLVRLAPKLTGNLGVKWNMTEAYGLTMHMNYTMQGSYRETIAGGLVSWRNVREQVTPFVLHAGLFMRFKDALIPTVKVDYKQYSVVTSYDINTSKLRTASNGVGGFEMSLYVRGNFSKSRTMGYQQECPRFEKMLDGAGSEAW